MNKMIIGICRRLINGRYRYFLRIYDGRGVYKKEIFVKKCK